MSKNMVIHLMLGIVVVLAACGGDPADSAGRSAEARAPGPLPVPPVVEAALDLAEGFASIYLPYEEIATALSEDRTDTVVASATRLAEAARALAAQFSVEVAGVSEEDAASVLEVLPELATAAVACAESADIEAARTAFQELSRLMVSYRDMLVGQAPLAAYCPMVDANWLQTGEEIVNPYYGAEMLRCGEIVRR